MNFLDEYNDILYVNPNLEHKFSYYLAKANLEYRLEELILCKESFLEALKHFKCNDNCMLSLLQLSCICSEFDLLVTFLKEQEENFSDYDFSDSFIKGFVKVHKAIINKGEVDGNELLHLASSNVEKSIACYLLSKLMDNEDIGIKADYCEMAIKLWKDNLAATVELWQWGYEISVDSISKLLSIDKIKQGNIPIEKNAESMNFKFIPLGGGNDIGASSYYLNIQELKVIVDAGIKIKGNHIEYPNYEILKENNLINDIEYLIITHAHLDHCGSVLELFRLNGSMKVLMTRETKELLRLNLKSQCLVKNQLYELDYFLEKVIITDFNKEICVKAKSVSIELYKAGHILGAASIMFRSESCNLFFTGDFSLRSQNTVEGLHLPKLERIDVLITETTYGDRHINKSYVQEYGNLQKYVTDKIREGKKVLIPAFAMGRAQEILSIIKAKADKENFRIYIDGSAVEATKIYEKYTKDKLKSPPIYFVKDELYNSKEDFIKQEIMNNRCCIISSSGMLLEGSASSEYAKQILQDPKGVCILTGYQAFDTVGAKLKEQMGLDCEKYITIDGNCYKIRSELKSFNLSAHSSLIEIVAVELFLKAKNVILIHGDYKDEARPIETKLKEFKNINVVQSINNKIIEM